MLVFDASRCVNCRYCEKVCSVRWVGQTKPSASAIKIDRFERFGPLSARTCNLCAGRDRLECVAVCPMEALARQGNVVKFDKDLCSQCEECVAACPVNAISFDADEEQVVLCDLCDGSPLCIAWCPENVLSVEGVPA